MTAESKLADAHARVLEVERVVTAAAAAAGSARNFFAEVDLEVAALAAERAETLKKSFRSGSAPPPDETGATAKERTLRLDAENRLAAARTAAEDLSAEAQEAKVAFDTARAELEAAARAVLSEETESYAAKVVALETEALSNLTQLEATLRSNASGWGSSSAAKLMIEAERGKASARRVADDLPAEAPAQDAASKAARSYAAKVVALEFEALSIRVRIEGAVRSRVLGWGSGIALNPLAKRVVQENLSTAIPVRNSPEWAGANKAADHWRERHAELLKPYNSQPRDSEAAA
jgi:hypothetical protein